MLISSASSVHCKVETVQPAQNQEVNPVSKKICLLAKLLIVGAFTAAIGIATISAGIALSMPLAITVGSVLLAVAGIFTFSLLMIRKFKNDSSKSCVEQEKDGNKSIESQQKDPADQTNQSKPEVKIEAEVKNKPEAEAKPADKVNEVEIESAEENETNSQEEEGDSQITCEITVFKGPTEPTSFAEFANPEIEEIRNTTVYKTTLVCDAKFSNLKVSCGSPQSSDTKFTIITVGSPSNPKVLWGRNCTDIHQNDPHCPEGAFSYPPSLLERMINSVLSTANFEWKDENPNSYSNIQWKVNITETSDLSQVVNSTP